MGNLPIICAGGFAQKNPKGGFVMSEPTFPIHPSSNNNNNNLPNNQEDYTMNNRIQPNYTKISNMPGIDGLILRLEDEGVHFGDRLLTRIDEENLIVLGSFFQRVSGVSYRDSNYDVVGELDCIVVFLLIAIGEEAVMWTVFSYLLDENGNFKDYGAADATFCMWIWGDVEYMIRAKEEFVRISNGMEGNDNEIFSYPTPVYTDRSHRYTAVEWVYYMFGRWEN